VGYITWTDSLVNGDNQTASHITNLKNDITSVVNGGITNANIASGAAIVESKIAFNITTGHDHDGVNSKEVSSAGVITRGTMSGAELNWVSTTTIKANAGVVEIDGSLYTNSVYSNVLDITVAGDYISGVSEQAVSTWVYIYAYNDSGTTWAIKGSTTAPAYVDCTGTATDGVLKFLSASSVWYRCIGAIYLNAVGAGEVTVFYQSTNKIVWDIPTLVDNTTSAGAWSAAISCAAMMPVISISGIFGVFHEASVNTRIGGTMIKRNGTTFETATFACGDYSRDSGTAGTEAGAGELTSFVDSSQQIQRYDGADTAAGSTIYCKGYWINIL